MFPIQINLTPAECYQAATCGIQRSLRAISRGSKHRLDSIGGWNQHIEGAAGELAAAKALGVYWPASVDLFQAADIQAFGRGLEIKTNLSRPEDGDLMVHQTPAPKPDTVYILVRGQIPTFNVIGWIRGSQLTAQHVRTLAAGHSVFIVPNAELNRFPIPTLAEDFFHDLEF
jgi:hypothetical protein